MTDAPPPRSAAPLSGPEKAAVVLLCLGEEAGGALMRGMPEEELRRIGMALSGLGAVPAEAVEAALAEFADAVGGGGPVGDGAAAARSLLSDLLPPDVLDGVLAGERRPRRERQAWRRLAERSPARIAAGLAQEQDQTVATILSNLPPKVAATVFPLLADARRAEVIGRMAELGRYPDHLIDEIEEAIDADLLGDDASTQDAPAHDAVAELLSILGPDDRAAALEALDRRDRGAGRAIRDRMFTFDDLIRVDPRGLARLMREVGGETVPIALASTHGTMRDHFLAALPARSRTMLEKEIAAAGEPSAEAGEAAQIALVDAAKALLRASDIELAARPD